MTLSMKVKGFDSMQSAMKRKGHSLKDMRIVNYNALTAVDSWIQRNFNSSGGNVGGWKPLSKDYKSQKVADGWSPKPLLKKGSLRRDWERVVTSQKVALVSKAEDEETGATDYGIQHNYGLGVPKRRILPTDKEIWPILKAVYSKFIKRSLSK